MQAAARIWGAAEAVHTDVHGPSREGELPFIRDPHFSPHLQAISAHFSEPAWQQAQAEGYAASLEETITFLETMPAE